MIVLGILIGLLIGAVFFFFTFGRFIVNERNKGIKYKKLFDLLAKWIMAEEKGYRIEDWIKRNQYKKVGIYGMGALGRKLFFDLKLSDADIIGIDCNTKLYFDNLDLYSPNDTIPDIDLLIVTPITYFDDIKRNMEVKVKCPIISLEQLIEE